MQMSGTGNDHARGMVQQRQRQNDHRQRAWHRGPGPRRRSVLRFHNPAAEIPRGRDQQRVISAGSLIRRQPVTQSSPATNALTLPSFRGDFLPCHRAWSTLKRHDADRASSRQYPRSSLPTVDLGKSSRI